MLHRTRLGFVLLAIQLALPAPAEVLSRQAGVTAPAAPPASVVPGVLESDSDVLLFLEQENLELPVAVAADITAPGPVLSSGDLTPGSVPAGTFVDSWFLHADAIGQGQARLSGAVRFDRPVLGVLTDRNRLIASEALLGSPGTTYAGAAGHTDPDSDDRLWLSDDRRTLSISWLVADAVDHVRVLTEGTADATYLASYAQLLSTRASVPPPSGSVFDYAFDNAFTVGDPSKIVLLTATIDINTFTTGWSGISTRPYAVWYDPAEQRWLVRRSIETPADGGGMHVLVFDAGGDAFVHTTSASNSSANYSCLDHPLLNDDPDARVLVSRNAGTGATPVHHDHFVGVFYNNAGSWCIFNQDIQPMALGRSFNVLVPPGDGTSFVHTADSGNTGAGVTTIDHPLLNDHPDRTPHVTQVWNPGGGGGVYDDRAHAVSYSDVSGRWSILETPGFVPLGSSFNVYVPSAPSHAQRHLASAGTLSSHQSVLAHPHLDGRRAPILLETQSLASGAPANPHATGIWFNGVEHILFNQDFASWPLGATTNLFRVPSGRRSIVHVAETPYNGAAWTFLDHWLTVKHPEALVFVAQNWNPDPSALGHYNDHVIGVWYDAVEEDWAVLNEDIAAMPKGAGFNVYVAPPESDAFVHFADAGNTIADTTTLDHPMLNGQPDADPLVTQNWNPPGSSGVLNDHPVAVDYDAAVGRWQIANQDSGNIPSGAAFNVLPLPEPGAGLMLASGVWLLALLPRRRRSGGLATPAA